MKRILFLLLIITLLNTNIIYADSNSKFSIKFTDTETSINKSVKNNQKQEQKSNTNPSQQTLFTGWQQVPNTNYWVYYVNNQLYSGWLNNNGWYYMGSDFIMTTNKWVESNGKWYYLGTDGKMLVNTTTPDGYKVDENGVWINTNNSDISTTSKYLYKRVNFNGSSSVTTSTKLGDETLKSNIIKMPNSSNFILPDTKTYNSLTFNYIITSPNSKNEYLLEIYVNDELIEEIDEFTGKKQELTIDFDKNSKLRFNWTVNTEEGSKTIKATTLYIYNGILSRNKDED